MEAWTSVDYPSLGIGLQPDPPKISDGFLAEALEIKEELAELAASLPSSASLGLSDSPDSPNDHNDRNLMIPPEQLKIRFFLAVCENDLEQMESAIDSDSLLVLALFKGYPAIVLAVILNNQSIVETLLNTYLVDPDTLELLKLGYTPLMYAVHFDNLPMVKLLLQYHSDPNFSPNEENKATAASIVSENCPAVYLYFKYHNLLQTSRQDDFVYQPKTFGLHDDTFEDELSYKIQMLTIASTTTPEPQDEHVAGESSHLSDSDEDSDLANVPEFDYSKAIAGQYIKYNDSDIPSLLEYIFSLRTKSHSLQHDARVPAAIIYQLIQYSHTKVGADDLTTFLFETFITRMRSVSNTKSGVMGQTTATDAASSTDTGDIVSLSYWLSVVQFVHFHFTRGGIYKKHLDFLQTLINMTQSLIATISNSINIRLQLLVDDCILDFTNLVDVSSVLYAKDWNFLKLKKNLNSYDAILDMLYPPSEEQLRMPSPVRYLQVLGALDYVLNLHMVHPLLRLQAYSQVFYNINATLFNRVISNSKYCSRAKAIQLRLNISALEDWLRSHSSRIYKPDQIGGLRKLTESVGGSPVQLSGLLDELDVSKDPHALGFLYKSLYHVGRTQLNPFIELLQWLQVVTGLDDEETFITTLNELDGLNYYQVFKVTKKMYRYEVNEPKVPKALLQLLRKLVEQQGEQQVKNSKMSYLSQSSFLLKELYININSNYIFGVALPNLSELIVSFGAGLGGMRKIHAKKYQPHLPPTVADDIDEIIAENRNLANDSYDYENADHAEHDEEYQHDIKDNGSFDRENMIYKKLEVPLVAHANFARDEIEVNPW